MVDSQIQLTINDMLDPKLPNKDKLNYAEIT